jgi:hypothetical protein
MPILHLGVIDQSYSDPPTPPQRQPKARKGKQRPRKSKSSDGLKTTGEVALMLESKYDVMAGFMMLHGQEVADALAESMKDAFEILAMGGPIPSDPLSQANADIGEMFREFLDREELAQLEEGVPTQAALHGVSHRFGSPYARRSRRPSFVDTGLYRESFISWFDY